MPDNPYTVTVDGERWYLHVLQEEHDETGTPYEIYYFAKEPGDNALRRLPPGYEVHVPGSGMPVLREE
jgi:hypothetical protein